VSSSIGLVGADDVESNEDRPCATRTYDPDSLEDDEVGEIIDIVDEDDAFDTVRNRLQLAALLANDFFLRGKPGVALRSRGEPLLDDGPAPFVLILRRFECIFHQWLGEENP
jgi:hypothetical protein